MRSRCACEQGCAHWDSNEQKPPKACMVDNRDLGTLRPYMFQAVQDVVGYKNKSGDSFTWVLGFCTPVAEPGGIDQCSSKYGGTPGYLQQYNDYNCAADFTEGLELKKSGDGVMLTMQTVPRPSKYKFRKANIFIRCDKTLQENVVYNDQNVTVDEIEGHPGNYTYTLRLRSKCACKGGCGKAKSHTSGFLIFLLVLLLLVLAYILGGVGYNKMTKPQETSFLELLPPAPWVFCAGCGSLCASFTEKAKGITADYKPILQEDDGDEDFDNDEDLLAN
eukprot:NODE_355_length_1019_cov_803.295876_g278_i0.p1 GENE.NODE_355_length_1019_cov_803.295876_g278_i0~~NODE_355_length_1019_cov_803.295876_g278_i0.p1  ORF type:complete len:277 (+),score=42.26 NODE_355_length_1019_cov_803.295876_g278_i0:61-891(+)